MCEGLSCPSHTASVRASYPRDAASVVCCSERRWGRGPEIWLYGNCLPSVFEFDGVEKSLIGPGCKAPEHAKSRLHG